MWAKKTKYGAGALVLCAVGAFLLGFYLISAYLAREQLAGGAGEEKEASVPGFARKWAEALALSEPQERRRLLAEALEADTRRRRQPDSLSEDERYFRARALELITLAQDYSSTQDFIERWVAGDPGAPRRPVR